MFFFANKKIFDILVAENERLQADNVALKATIIELIDKFVHQKHPERLVKQSAAPSEPMVMAEMGMGDPLSVAERAAWNESRPKEQE